MVSRMVVLGIVCLLFSDEPMENASTQPEVTPEEMEEEGQADTSTPIDAPERESEEEKPTMTVSGGRRRGRRKVMKKKTMKDAEGYLGNLLASTGDHY